MTRFSTGGARATSSTGRTRTSQWYSSAASRPSSGITGTPISRPVPISSSMNTTTAAPEARGGTR